MARSKRPPTYKKRRRKQKRSDAEYVTAAKNLVALVPSLRPLSKRKRLTPQEKARITRLEKPLIGVPRDQLFAVSPARARVLKDQLFNKHTRAIQLRGLSPDAKIKFRGRNIVIIDHGRTYLYWHLSRSTVRSKRGMKAAARDAFRQQYPIENVMDLVREAFTTQEVQQIWLWAHAGAVGDPQRSADQFEQWVNSRWSAGRYIEHTLGRDGSSDPGKWVNGIVILLENAEYRAERDRLERENEGVEAEMLRKAAAHRKREKKRLAAKGLADYDGTPLPVKKKRKSNVKRKTSPPPKKNRKKAVSTPRNRKANNVKAVRKTKNPVKRKTKRRTRK